MIRLLSSSFFFLFCFTVALVLTGCGGIGFSDATDEYYTAAAQAGDDADPFASNHEATNDGLEQEDDSQTETGEDEADEDETGEDGTDEGFASECLFGTSIEDMGEADSLEIGDFEHVTDTHELTGLEVDQLLNGFAAHGPAAVEDIDELFERFVDDGRVMVRTVVDIEGARAYTHLAFWSEGSEKGYIFFENTLRLMAAVDGGTIYACVVGF